MNTKSRNQTECRIRRLKGSTTGKGTALAVPHKFSSHAALAAEGQLNCRGAFYNYNVWTRHQRFEKLRYIHRNPVQHGLIEKPEQSRWRSFRVYAFGEKEPVVENDWTVLKMKIRFRVN